MIIINNIYYHLLSFIIIYYHLLSFIIIYTCINYNIIQEAKNHQNKT